jgi:ribonucleotide reductase beta subunit family protein with ferritin-like domain
MNATTMRTYIEFVADRMLQSLGYEKHYHARNPFDWMDLISLQVTINVPHTTTLSTTATTASVVTVSSQ